MFARFGASAAQAEVRAMTMIYTQVGYISMQIEEDREERITRMSDYIELFAGSRPPSAAEERRFRARHGGALPTGQFSG